MWVLCVCVGERGEVFVARVEDCEKSYLIMNSQL